MESNYFKVHSGLALHVYVYMSMFNIMTTAERESYLQCKEFSCLKWETLDLILQRSDSYCLTNQNKPLPAVAVNRVSHAEQGGRPQLREIPISQETHNPSNVIQFRSQMKLYLKNPLSPLVKNMLMFFMIIFTVSMTHIVLT